MSITSNTLYPNREEFNALIASDTPVLVDFWAEWCPPCKMLLPIIEALADKYDGKANVAKINTEEHPEIASEYEVSLIPTVIIFKSGKIVETIVGANSSATYEKVLDSLI